MGLAHLPLIDPTKPLIRLTTLVNLSMFTDSSAAK